jgi:leucyl aminopeptidase (aminopeptidase T)
MKIAETVTAQIVVEFGENPGAFADVPAARRVAVAKAGEPIGKTLYARGVRQVFLGNNLYPTKSNAELYGVPQAELARMFWDAVALDPARLQTAADALRAALAGAKQVHVRHANGTDLKLRVEGRPVYVSDGAISREDEQKGGAACSVWLPAGEVYLVPVPGSAEGTVVVDRQVFDGKDIQGLTLSYKAGKLASMSAKSGLEPLKGPLRRRWIGQVCPRGHRLRHQPGHWGEPPAQLRARGHGHHLPRQQPVGGRRQLGIVRAAELPAWHDRDPGRQDDRRRGEARALI